MAYATAIKTPIAHPQGCSGYGASPCDGGSKANWDVLTRPEQDICLENDEFQLNGPYGQRLIARFTGRTRRVNGGRVPTLDVFDVATVVEMVGQLPVMIGRRGNRIEGGTWWTSPNAPTLL